MGFTEAEIKKTVDVMNQILADSGLLRTISAVSERCCQSLSNGGKIMFCGNGGSAADAQHLAAELVGKLMFPRPGLAGLALTTDTSALTAIGNDFGYEYVFSRQVEALGRPGDVLVGISTSGRSKNVLAAFTAARKAGITTVGMTGASGGDMANASDFLIKVPSTETPKIQEGHIVIGHIFCAAVEAVIYGGAQK